jgi:hypothetical protein
MRGLVPMEDRFRFERLVSEVEQAVWDNESVTADLARLLAIAITEGPIRPPAPVELTDVVASALRGVDALLASRGVLVDIDAPPALFALGDGDRLEHLLATALAISACAARPRTHARLRYALDGDAVVLSLAPYRVADPRGAIVEALARSQRCEVSCADEAFTMRLPAVVSTASV